MLVVVAVECGSRKSRTFVEFVQRVIPSRFLTLFTTQKKSPFSDGDHQNEAYIRSLSHTFLSEYFIHLPLTIVAEMSRHLFNAVQGHASYQHPVHLPFSCSSPRFLLQKLLTRACAVHSLPTLHQDALQVHRVSSGHVPGICMQYLHTGKIPEDDLPRI